LLNAEFKNKNMTQQEYMERNAKGFEGDSILEQEVRNLVSKHKINLILETGSMVGFTAKKFSQMAETHSCEMKESNFKQAVVNSPDTQFYLMSSPDFLRQMLALNKDKTILCYLDAHGPHTTPIIEELEVIAASGVKPVIVIHDFVNPNDKTMGFDSYQGQSYTLEWLMPYLEKIYRKVNYYFNERAEGARRGVLFLEPQVDNRIDYPEVPLEITTEKKRKGRPKKA